MIFTGLWNLHNCRQASLEVRKFGFTLQPQFASLQRIVVLSTRKLILSIFKTLISIIFEADHSIVFLLFILCSRRFKIIGKQRKIRLENIENRPRGQHFFIFNHFLRMHKITPFYYPPIKITWKNTNFDWFIDPLTIEEV